VYFIPVIPLFDHGHFISLNFVQKSHTRKFTILDGVKGGQPVPLRPKDESFDGRLNDVLPLHVVNSRALLVLDASYVISIKTRSSSGMVMSY